MIEAVSTLSVQGAALRSQPQNNVPVTSIEPVEKREGSFINSRVRVDNLMDVAILEFRNSGGEVIRQYPSKSQLRGYERAAELKSSSNDSSSESSTVIVDEPESDVSFAPLPSATAAPSPSAAPSFSGGQGFAAAAASSDSGSTTQSIVV